MEKSILNEFADAFAHSKSSRFRKMALEDELRIEGETFFPGGHLTRYRIRNTAQRGMQEIAQLAPGFSVITTSFEAIESQTTSYRGCGWVVLQCCISGEYDITINDGEPQRLHPGDCRLDILLTDATWQRRQIASTHYRYISLFLRPDDLLLLLSIGNKSRSMLQALLSPEGNSDLRNYTFSASKNLIASVNEIAEFGDFGGLRPAFLKAKAIELLVFSLNKVRWHDRECDHLQQRSTLSRKVKMAYAVQEIIEREFAVPHSLNELATRVGSNRTTLMQAFKAEYHQTPMQYLKTVRLENAREILLHHEGAVSAVAEYVGYIDTASFIRAYRKVYGVTPGRLSS
jgi:AraC-like DNA-binding protein